MDTAKILTVLCAFLLIVCLVLSITALTVLRNAMNETEALQRRTEAIMSGLDDCVDALEKKTDEEASVPTSTDTAFPKETAYRLQSLGDKLCVYDTDGNLIQVCDVSPSALPPADREALAAGITLTSWQEVRNLITDYTS